MIQPDHVRETAPSIPLSSSPTYLSNKQVQHRLDCCEQTLRNWRKAGTGPCYVRFGTHIRYRLEDIEAFERSRTFTSSADEIGALAKAA